MLDSFSEDYKDIVVEATICMTIAISPLHKKLNLRLLFANMPMFLCYQELHLAELTMSNTLIKREIQKMVEQNILEPSTSPWGAPCLLVKKKTERGVQVTPRLVWEYRKLNKVTKPDVYPLPHVQMILDQLGGKKWFTNTKWSDHLTHLERVLKRCDKTDASSKGLGAVLSQIGPDNKEHPVRYPSRALQVPESKWTTREQELLALIWACETFHRYLWGRKFLIQTDHANLQWLQAVSPQKSRLARWAMRLAEYDFELQHHECKDLMLIEKNQLASAAWKLTGEDEKQVFKSSSDDLESWLLAKT
ncbi:Retrovirus-related Pol poly from transposon [Paramuricea clavata]|uniref:Retrovirus-related Pol poly from transposon n=1 Tax=Paramuricea clavata TaxID=317549 RepID=A0A7D9ICD8_PARCT|nr:Retrovirus-related Pol poly from transposon [Paramuricea clavata]